ncbi:helix-turn-helix domain-containing protein [Tundrisphaera lichenicola]|uniref:helix-turn-helix domain-containing protein n=1 Tax=Tundrisphaera lichenicola TaxID=2029860 RepID=UPI003EBE09E4
MESFFFRVEHDLLRSESFKTLGGSAIKVYLVLGLYADFATGWAYPSIRTIARQAGLSRQTVLAAIEDLARLGLLATSKSKGRSTAYKIIRQAPERPSGKKTRVSQEATPTGPLFLEEGVETVPISLGAAPKSVPESLGALAQFLGPSGPEPRPEREQGTREDSTSIPIPGTPFRLSSDGRLLVAVDLQELLTDQGIPRRLAERLAAQKDPEDVAKVLLNALYLKSQGKLQNGPGYIRAGIEDGYDLLPQVANRLETRRKELEAQQRVLETKRDQLRQEKAREAENAAIALVIESLRTEEVDELVRQAVAQLPEPIVRRNPTLSNPFVRGKVYELAGGEPIS